MVTVEQLVELGFSVVGGMVDYKGKNYGRVTKLGVELTEEGQALMARLVVAEPAASPSRGRKPKQDPAAVIPQDLVDELE